MGQSDLVDWEANYGTVAPISATSTAVPEPTAVLLAIAAAFILPRRDRYRSGQPRSHLELSGQFVSLQRETGAWEEGE